MAKLNRKLKMGMVGGGPGAFIGDVHRKAAQLDGGVELVAGAFSQDEAKSRQQGEALYLTPSRVYGSYKDMIACESRLPEGERIDFVSVVTPNFNHYEIASAFFSAGFHVVLDKPMTFSLDQAYKLQKLVHSRKKQVLALTHNYTGYPMVKLARDLVRGGKLGKVLKVVVQYPQGWLIQAIEKMGAKQAEALRQSRLHGRHRHPRGKPGRIHHRPQDHRTLRRPWRHGQGPQARR